MEDQIVDICTAPGYRDDWSGSAGHINIGTNKELVIKQKLSSVVNGWILPTFVKKKV